MTDESYATMDMIYSLSLSYAVIYDNKIQAKTSWGCKKYFPYSYEGFKSACEWLDKRRVILAERLI